MPEEDIKPVTKEQMRIEVLEALKLKLPHEKFSAYGLAKEMYRKYTMDAYRAVKKSEWEKRKVYTSELFKELYTANVITFVEEIKGRNIPTRLYKINWEKRRELDATINKTLTETQGEREHVRH
jgi:hypothetical protein